MDTEAETETIVEETTTAKYPRRVTPKFKSRKEYQKTEEDQNERPYLNGGARRSELPRRNNLRRRPSGASAGSNGNIVSTTLASLAARRPFRVAGRRRPFNLTTSTTSTTTTTTTQATDLDESEEALQDVEDNDYEEPINPPAVNPKTVKIQRRPLVSLKEERPVVEDHEEHSVISQKEVDQNPSATNEEENKRQSKKYNTVSKKNRLEQALKDRDVDEEYYTTTDKKTTEDNEDVSAETAVAIAAHQLLSAPIPIVPNYDDITKTYRKTSPKTISEFEFTSQYTDPYHDSRKTAYTDDYSSTTLAPNRGYNVQTSTGPAYSLSSLDFDAPKISPTTSFAPKTSYSTNAFTTKISQPPVVSEPTITHAGLTGTRYPLAQTTYTNEYTTKDASSAEYEPTIINSEVPTKLSYSDLPTTNFDIPKSTFRTTFPTKESKSTRFSARPIASDISSTTFSPPKRKIVRYRPSTTINSQLETITPSTGRYLGSSPKLVPVPVEDYAFSTDGYTGLSQEPAYFTREYLLESPVTKAYDDEYQYLSPVTTSQTPTRKLPRKKIHRKISTTQRPTTEAFVPVVTSPKPRRVSSVKPFEKVQKPVPNRTYRPILNYDYYDDGEEKVAEKYVEGTKVVLHAKGTIECLDIGNFPHPTSCKKFISCARMESGALLGWEYVCPKGLSFDPVGGICNWSAGLGCVEKEKPNHKSIVP